MALCRTGGLLLKRAMPTLGNPVFLLPSSVNLQKRYAARKGYRDKVKRQKRTENVNAAKMSNVEAKLIKKFKKINKTIDLKKPEPPDDDVFIKNLFNHAKYSLPEIIEFHREYHHPTVYNNPSAPVSLKIEIRMIGKKETQFLKPFSGVAPIPYPFTLSLKREVLVFCQSDDIDFAFKCGASMAGDVNLIKKVKEGSVQPVLYDYIIAHNSMMPELSPIRNILKLQLPRAKVGTLTNDLKYAINKFLHGIQYSCVKVGDSQDFGVIDLDIGTLDMETSHLEANFRAVIEDIEKNRPKKEGKFITWIWCLSRPSTEEFSVDLSQYIDSGEKAEEPVQAGAKGRAKVNVADEDDDDDEVEVMKENR